MPRASVRWRVVVAVVAVPVLVAVPVVYAGAAEGEPTITFTVTGTPPLICGTRPNVSSLSVKDETKIVIANLTTVSATVDVGKTRLLDLLPGMGALVKLKPGQHELRMLPACVVVDEAVVAVVTVLPSAPPSGAPPGPTGDPDAPVEGPVTMAVATSSLTGTAGSAAGPGSTGGGAIDPGAGEPAAAGPGPLPTGDPPGGSARSVADGGPIEIDEALRREVVDARAIDLAGARDPKGVRLLALIAAICVFGVTAAIIRAIVSQRTSTAVTM